MEEDELGWAEGMLTGQVGGDNDARGGLFFHSKHRSLREGYEVDIAGWSGPQRGGEGRE